MNVDVQLSAVWVCAEGDPDLIDTLRRYAAALLGADRACELILVTHSEDQRLLDSLRGVLEQSGLPGKIVSLAPFCDDASAVLAGVQSAGAAVVAVLPTLLDVDPAELAPMLAEIDAGVDYVASWRFDRSPPRVNLRRFGFNAISRCLTGVALHDLNSGLRLLRRDVIENIPVYGGLLRFLPILAAWEGYRVKEVKTRLLDRRRAGQRYRPGVYWRRLIDLLTLFFLLKFTRKPLQFFGMLGGTLIVPGLAILVGLVIGRLQGIPVSNRPLLLLGVLFVVIGVELFSLGLLGELIMFTHARSVKEYRVDKVFEREPTP